MQVDDEHRQLNGNGSAIDVDRSISPPATSLPVFPPSTGIVYSTEVNGHYSLFEDHFECPDRITRTWQLFQQNGLDKKMRMLPIRPVHRLEALLVHTEAHWETTQEIQSR